MKTIDRIRLVGLIESTFLDIPKPKHTKRVARAFDDEWFPNKNRIDELRIQDKEQLWQDLEPEEIYEHSDVLCWLSPEGFRFYFPAFLNYSLQNWEKSHDRVQHECMEVIGREPDVVNALTIDEARVSAETLTELSVDPNGQHYHADQSIRVLELHIATAGRHHS